MSARGVRGIVGRQSPSVVAPDAIVPPVSTIAGPLSTDVLQLKGRNGRPGGVVTSNLPLAVRVPRTARNPRGLEVADLDWRRSGDRVRVDRAAVGVSLPVDPAGRTAFGDLGARLAPGARRVVPSVTGETVTYPGVGRDRDLVVRSTSVGVQAAWVLRSPAADRTVRVPVDVPAGGRLVRMPDTSVAIRDGQDRTVGSMSAPSANDAAHREVPLDVAVEGATIVITVRPDRGRAVWPVVIDPLFSQAQFDAGSASSNGSFAGWTAARSRPDSAIVPRSVPGGPTAGGTGGFDIVGAAAPAGMGAGQYRPGDYGSWNRYSPGDPSYGTPQALSGRRLSPEHAWWYRFDLGGLSYRSSGAADPNNAAGFLTADGMGQTEQRWQRQVQGSTYAAPRYDATVNNGPPKGFPSGTSGAGAAIYSGRSLDDAAGSAAHPDNLAAFSLQDNGTNKDADRPATALHVGWYRLYATDNVAPKIISARKGSGIWTATPPATIDGFQATDRGLGVQHLALTDDTGAVRGAVSTESCPGTGQVACAFTSQSRSFPLGQVPEGRHTYVLRAQDAAGNLAAQDVPLAVDRSGPAVSLSGSLYRSRAKSTGDPAKRSLFVSATDGNRGGSPATQRSGVESIRVTVNGKTVASEDQSSTGDSRALALSWKPSRTTFKTSKQTVRVESRDRAGNPPTVSTFTVRSKGTVTSASLRPRTFRVRRGGRYGSRLTVKTTKTATLAAVVSRRTAGVTRNGRCVTKRRGRTGKACTRLTTKGTVRLGRIRKGTHRVRITGRVRGRRLAPGKYQLVVRPSGESNGKIARFSVRR